ncbi:16988_t:CDS:2, partial [Funneliformis geosporum]
MTKWQLGNTSISEKQNYNASYLFIHNQEAEQSLIPLLPEYVVFTLAGKKQFKLLILKNNNQLLFSWEEFDSDALYAEKKVQGIEQLTFHCMLKKYSLSSNTSFQSIRSLSDPQKKEEMLNQSLKQEGEKIDAFLCENASNSDQNNLFDVYNILKFVKERSQKIIKNHSVIQQLNEIRKEQFSNYRRELAGFDFDKELVSYKSKTPEQIHNNIFWLSFEDLLTDFEEQIEAICSYLDSKDTFVSMKTALMEDQKELIKVGILYITLYANTLQEIPWGQLGILKQRWKFASIMLLTAIYTQSEVNEISRSLNIKENNFTLIHGS